MRALTNGILALIGLWSAGAAPQEGQHGGQHGMGQRLGPQTAGIVDAQSLDKELVEKVRRHQYLSRVTLEPVKDWAPYLFLVQRKAGQPSGRPRAMAEAAAALLEPMRERFERELARPLGLAQRPSVPRLVVVVLASAEDFEECAGVISGSLHFDTRSNFERSLGAAILYDDPDEQRDPAERARSAHHALVHALQHAWFPGTGEAPVRSWLFEGMADYLARFPSDAASPPSAESLARLVADTETPARRWAALRTLEELCSVEEPLGLQEFFRQKTSDPRLVPVGDTWLSFYRQAALLYHFLEQAEGGRFRPGLQAFLASAFAGDQGPDALAKSFAPLAPAELERAFLTWIVEERRALEPPADGGEIDERAILEALARTPAGCVPFEEPKPEEAPLPAVPGLDDLTAEERFDWALAEVVSEGMSAGRARLQELLAGTLEPDLRARVEREERRVAAWIGLRDAYLTKLAAEQRPLNLSRDASAEELPVKSFENGVLVLAEKYGGTRRVGSEEIDPLGLAYQIPKEGFPDAWARYYPFVLFDDGRWKKLLKDDGGPAGELLADAKTDYAARIATGRCVQRLEEVLQGGLPETAGAIDQQLEALRAFLTGAAESSLVQRKRPDLLLYARELLRRRFDLLTPAERVAGKLEPLDGARVRLTYAFDDPRELDDFSAEPYGAAVTKTLPALAAGDEPFQVSEGVLTARGHASLRTWMDLAAPLTVRYVVTYARGETPSSATYFGVGLCDDGQQHFLWAVNLNGLQCLDLGRSDFVVGPEGSLALDVPYALEVQHDGQRFALRRGGQELLSLGAGSRRKGAILLKVHSDLWIRVDELVIEGELEPTSFDRAKQAWIERGLAGL